MDTVFALDEKLNIFNITTTTSLHIPENIALTIILGLIISMLVVGGLAANTITLAIITRTYLETSPVFKYVKVFALISITYLSISLVIFVTILFNYNDTLSITLNLEPVLVFNLTAIICMLCVDRYVNKHFSDCYFYVFFFWCIASVYIHDFCIIFQVGHSVLYIIILIIIIIKFLKYDEVSRNRSEEFTIFRLKLISLYVLLWILKNILLFLLCYVFCFEVTVLNTMINIILSCIYCVVITYMVYKCGYRYKIYFNSSKEFAFETPLENTLLYSLERL